MKITQQSNATQQIFFYVRALYQAKAQYKYDCHSNVYEMYIYTMYLEWLEGIKIVEEIVFVRNFFFAKVDVVFSLVFATFSSVFSSLSLSLCPIYLPNKNPTYIYTMSLKFGTLTDTHSIYTISFGTSKIFGFACKSVRRTSEGR